MMASRWGPTGIRSFGRRNALGLVGIGGPLAALALAAVVLARRWQRRTMQAGEDRQVWEGGRYKVVRA